MYTNHTAHRCSAPGCTHSEAHTVDNAPTMRDLLTTRNQNCWKEVIEKEAYTRLSWKVKYGQKQLGHQAPGIRRKRAPGTLPTLTHLPKIQQAPQKEEAGEQKDEEQEELVRGKDWVFQPEMRPATPQTRTLLYDGFSKEGKGRSMYLQRRKREGPEDKFQYPILSSWDYGWRLGDMVKEFRPSVNGRSAIVQDTFYIRNGIFYGPSKTDRMLHM